MTTFSRKSLTAIAAAAAAIALPAALLAAPKAKITPKQAEAAATKAVPGKATKATYEFEDGHWQYAV
ncbi:MAG: PepSY domain-containing protein, partial [Armatimonadota bacterium]|nr:PepSY domain-containing protein [Armatimonadota bacterium]